MRNAECVVSCIRLAAENYEYERTGRMVCSTAGAPAGGASARPVTRWRESVPDQQRRGDDAVPARRRVATWMHLLTEGLPHLISRILALWMT